MKAILNIALVAHDSRKNELLDWVRFNADLLSKDLSVNLLSEQRKNRNIRSRTR